MDEVFARAEADFQPQRFALGDGGDIQRGAVGVVFQRDPGDRDVWQIAQVLFLGAAQGLAVETTVEIAPWRAGGMGV